MRVFLIRPLCVGEEPEFAEPLGIERLAGYLLAKGIRDVHLFDRRLYERERDAGIAAGTFWDDVRSVVAEGAPDVIGVSLMTSADVRDAGRVLVRMRSMCPEARLVAGGLHVTMAREDVARMLPRGTELIAGEGEEPLHAFVSGTSRIAPLTPDDWAHAYRPYLERYAALGCAVNMQTSRGCPGTCAFCATPRLPANLRVWRPRRVSLVADEMESVARRLEAAGLPAVCNFVDDDFGPFERLEELADELSRRGELHVTYSCEMRMRTLAHVSDLGRRLKSLRETGLTRIFVGVESLDPNTLARWHKRYDVGCLPHVASSFAESGVRLQVGYIMWHAAQTVRGALEEAHGLHRLGLYTHQAAMSRMIVFPGCALAEEAGSADGLEALSAHAQEFYQIFLRETDDLRRRWMRAAIAEPHASAAAWLTGDDEPARVLVDELHEVNALSYAAFTTLAESFAIEQDV